jgi:hypothetical protein
MVTSTITTMENPKETTVADLVDDLAMSMDHTDDECDQIRRSWGN